MTIDEAIAHAIEVAKRRMAEYENHYDKDTHYYPTQCKKCAEKHIQLAEWLEELKQYRAIGTPEECRAAVEKTKEKEPIIDKCTCPSCGTYNEVVKERRNTVVRDTVYCWHCGQALSCKRDIDI